MAHYGAAGLYGRRWLFPTSRAAEGPHGRKSERKTQFDALYYCSFEFVPFKLFDGKTNMIKKNQKIAVSRRRTPRVYFTIMQVFKLIRHYCCYCDKPLKGTKNIFDRICRRQIIFPCSNYNYYYCTCLPVLMLPEVAEILRGHALLSVRKL